MLIKKIAALEIDWIEGRRFFQPTVQSVQLIDGPRPNTPGVYSSSGNSDRFVMGAGYSQPLAKSVRALLDAFEKSKVAALTSGEPDQFGSINATPGERDGLAKGSIRVRISSDAAHHQQVQSVVVSAEAGAAKEILEAARATQANLFKFADDFDARRDGETVPTI